MRIEPVSPEVANRLFRDTKVQNILNEFARMEDSVVRCVLDDGAYSSISSAQQTYRRAITRLGYPMTARVMGGKLYLIKTLTTKELKGD